jgi:hypothetical protein
MSLLFEELDWRPTPIGTLSLRRRKQPITGIDVYEIKLNEEFLMSSLFTVAEVELAKLGLAAASGAELDVVVGGLGLGYTADAVLDDPRVHSLVVVDALPEVIEWHQRELLPLGERLTHRPTIRAPRFLVEIAGQGDIESPAHNVVGDADDPPILCPSSRASPGLSSWLHLLRSWSLRSTRSGSESGAENSSSECSSSQGSDHCCD